MIRGYVEILMNMLPIIASIIVFAVFVTLYGALKLTPAKVYTTLSLFNLMSTPMRMLVMTLIQYTNSKAGLARLDHFFLY
jgi:ATP-binding cassette subfamily C (CFTR/MRP) protein 1